MEFSRQEYWSRLPLPSPGDLPDPGIKPTSLCLLHWQVDSLSVEPLENALLCFSTQSPQTAMSCLKKNLLIVVKYTYHKIHHVSYLKAYSSVTVHIFIVLYNHRCRTFSSPQKETPIATKQWLTQIPTPSPGLPVCFPSPWICLVYILDVSRFRRCVPYKWNHTIIWPFVSGFFHNVFEVHPHCSMCQNSFPSHC